MNARLEVRLLGPLEVRLAGDLVVLPGGRARALLALLALSVGRTLSVDRLVDHLWGAAPPPTATTALQGLVCDLRKRLEPGRTRTDPPQLLVTRHPGYLLAIPDDQVDVHRFRSLLRTAAAASGEGRADLLRDALSLWRGSLLEDVDCAVGPDVTEAAALDELRLGALEERIGADLALGRHAELIGEIETLATEHPYRERLRAQLMLALYRSDRQIDALDVWARTRATLAEQVGVEPGPGLRTLHQAILEHDPGLDLAAAGPDRSHAGEHARELTARAGELIAAAGARIFERHYDAETAAELFARAELLLPSDHPQHDDVADRVPETFLMLGRHGDADAWLKRALVGTRARGDTRRQLRLHLERARIQLIVGPDPIPMGGLEALALNALSRAQEIGSDDLTSQACYVLGLIALRRGDPVRMEELARIALPAAERSGSPRERLASRWWLALALVEGPTPTEDAITECEGLVELGSAPHLGVLTELARLHAIHGRHAQAHEHLAHAEALVQRRPGMLRPAMFLALRAAEVDLMAGRPDPAVPRLRRALALTDDLGEADPRAQVSARLSRVLAAQGQPGEAADLAHLSRRTAPVDSVTAQSLWRAAMAAVRSTSNDGGAVSASRQLLDEAVAIVPVAMELLRHDLRGELADRG